MFINTLRDWLADMLDVARQTICYSKTVVDQWITGSMSVFKAQALTVGRQGTIIYTFIQFLYFIQNF